MSRIRTLYLLPLLAFLSSCEGNTTVEISLSNRSSVEVGYHFVGIMRSDTIHGQLAAGRTEILLLDDTRGGRKDAQPVSSWIKDLKIISTLGDTLQTDANEVTNWSVEVERRSRIPADYKHAYEFEFDDAGFEP